MFDTICAISTTLGVGAISIIRLSGEKSIEIANKIVNLEIDVDPSRIWHNLNHNWW